MNNLTQKDINKIWEAYKQYAMIASGTQDMKSENVSDFLGYLEKCIKAQNANNYQRQK